MPLSLSPIRCPLSTWADRPTSRATPRGALAEGVTRWRGAIVALARGTTSGSQLHDEITRGYKKAASKLDPKSGALPSSESLRRATSDLADDVCVLVVSFDGGAT